MGFDLKSTRGPVTEWTRVYWSLMLAIADRYGWRRRGTAPPDGVAPEAWDGNYDTNEGQRVLDADAAALAAALRSALAATDLQDVAQSIYDDQMRAATAEAHRILQSFGGRDLVSGEPPGLVRRLNLAWRTLRRHPPEPDAKPPRKWATLPREEVVSALDELAGFCDHGEFVIG